MRIEEFRVKYAFVFDAIKAAFPGASVHDGAMNYETEYAVCFTLDDFVQCFRCEVLVREEPTEFEEDEDGHRVGVMPAGGWEYQVLELTEERLQGLILRAKQKIEEREEKK